MTAKRAPVAAPTGAAEQHVVREHEVGGQVLAQRRRVRLDVRVALGLRQVLEQPCLEALVAVEDEHGQHGADARAHGRRAGEVEPLGVRLLGEHRHVVAGARPLADERLRVDVRSRPAQQIAVPDEDAHERQ